VCIGALKLQVSFAKEPYKRDDILQKRPIMLRSLHGASTYICVYLARLCAYVCVFVSVREKEREREKGGVCV